MSWGLNEIKRSILPLITRLMTNDYHTEPLSTVCKNQLSSCAFSIFTLPAMSVPVSVTETQARDLRWTWGIFTVPSHVHRSSPYWPSFLPWCPLSCIAWSVSPPCFQGGNQRGTFFQALQVKLIPVQGNSIFPSELVSSKENIANRCFPLSLSPFLVSRISLMLLIYFGFTVCIRARGLYTLSCKYIFTFPSSFSKPQVKITFIT